MTIKWSFSYNSFVQLSLYTMIHLLHGPFLCTHKQTVLCFVDETMIKRRGHNQKRRVTMEFYNEFIGK